MEKVKYSLLFVIMLFLTGSAYAETFDGVRALVSRRIPWLEKYVEFKSIPSKTFKNRKEYGNSRYCGK